MVSLLWTDIHLHYYHHLELSARWNHLAVVVDATKRKTSKPGFVIALHY